MGRISKLARMQLEDAKEDLSAAKEGKMDDGEEDTAMDEDQKEEEDKSAEKTSKEGKDSKENEYVLWVLEWTARCANWLL